MITETVGNGTLSIDHSGVDGNGLDGYRQTYVATVSDGNWEYIDTIRSGVGAGVDERDALGTLVSFLSACAESRRYGRDGENRDLFPDHVGEWAEENSDELEMLSIALSEPPHVGHYSAFGGTWFCDTCNSPYCELA